MDQHPFHDASAFFPRLKYEIPAIVIDPSSWVSPVGKVALKSLIIRGGHSDTLPMFLSSNFGSGEI